MSDYMYTEELFPSLKGFDLCLDSTIEAAKRGGGWVSIPQRVRPLPRQKNSEVYCRYSEVFPSLKGFDLCLDPP